jgi:hypothetical protein
MKEYIMSNTMKRANTKVKFEQDFYKLMNNAVFGKSMENVKDHQELFVTNSKFLPNYVRKNNYKSFDVINNDLIIVKTYKTSVYLNKPIFIGGKVLDISKLIMYEFMYDVLIPTFKDKLKLHYMDTDSFILSFQMNNVELENKMMEIITWLDTSEYDKDFQDSPLYKNHPFNDRNKKTIGKFKSETKGWEINGFVGLRSKMYCIATESEENKKCKGIPKASYKFFNFDTYKNLLLENKKENDKVEQTKIVSKKHEIITEVSVKKNLCIFDDKNWIHDDKIHMRILGHYLNN